jgi:hypothetical protein
MSCLSIPFSHVYACVLSSLASLVGLLDIPHGLPLCLSALVPLILMHPADWFIHAIEVIGVVSYSFLFVP